MSERSEREERGETRERGERKGESGEGEKRNRSCNLAKYMEICKIFCVLGKIHLSKLYALVGTIAMFWKLKNTK